MSSEEPRVGSAAGTSRKDAGGRDSSAPDAQDRIISALRTLSAEEQKLFVAALDKHAAGECGMEEALAEFVGAVLAYRGARFQ